VRCRRSLTPYFRQRRQCGDVIEAKIENWQKTAVKSIIHSKTTKFI